MSEATARNSRMLRDTVLYMGAKSLEGIVGILIISRLTHLFTDYEIGRYALWNITATTLAMLSIQWLSQSASRYLHEYEIKDERSSFYSTVFWCWLKVNVCAVFISVALGAALGGLGEERVPGFLSFVYGDDFYIVFILTAAYFVTYNTSQLLIALLSVKRKAVTNLFISVFSSAGKLALILTFAYSFGSTISIIFLSYVICDLAVIIIALASLSAHAKITKKAFSPELSKQFGRYGTPLVGNLATTTALNNSDRFIIQHYLGAGPVGVYTTNYSVVSAVFTMLQTAMMRGSYPTILKTYAEGDKNLTEKLVSMAVRNYLIIAVPAVVGIGVLSRPLADLIFEKRFAAGSTVMVWVALGMMFLGLTEYSNKPWELSAKTWNIFRNSLLGGIANLLLNIIFIPYFGYMTAAYSTFAGFFIYFCLSRYGSAKMMKWSLGLRTYASVIGSAALMGVSIVAAIRFFGVNSFLLFVYVLAGAVLYGAALALTGEVNEEIETAKIIIGKIRRKTI